MMFTDCDKKSEFILYFHDLYFTYFGQLMCRQFIICNITTYNNILGILNSKCKIEFELHSNVSVSRFRYVLVIKIFQKDPSSR
jgi:hypothetical protein